MPTFDPGTRVQTVIRVLHDLATDVHDEQAALVASVLEELLQDGLVKLLCDLHTLTHASVQKKHKEEFGHSTIAKHMRHEIAEDLKRRMADIKTAQDYFVPVPMLDNGDSNLRSGSTSNAIVEIDEDSDTGTVTPSDDASDIATEALADDNNGDQQETPYKRFRRSWTKMTPTEAAAFHDDGLYTNWARELDHAFYEDWAEQLNDAWGLNYACGL